LQACEPEALQECLGCRKAQTAVGTGRFLHKREIAEFHDEAALVGVEKAVSEKHSVDNAELKAN
jgi:hypothetical protein